MEIKRYPKKNPCILSTNVCPFFNLSSFSIAIAALEIPIRNSLDKTKKIANPFFIGAQNLHICNIYE